MHDRDLTRRRDFIRVGALSSLGLTLPRLLAAEEHAKASGRTESSKKATSCILLWLGGGPSHIDSFDPKPDAPAEIRGEFKSIPTKIPGVHFTEHVARLANRI